MEPVNDERYTIREISRETGVPAHTLRFWERALGPVLQPHRTPGGQRRYDDAHLATIREVHRLLTEEELSLGAIRRALQRRRDPAGPDGAVSAALLADPAVQRALDEVAQAVKQHVLHLLESPVPDAAAPAPPGTRPEGAAP